MHCFIELFGHPVCLGLHLTGDDAGVVPYFLDIMLLLLHFIEQVVGLVVIDH